MSNNRSRPYRVIDTDIHHTIADWSDLQPYLAEPWRTKIVDGRSRVGSLGLENGRNRSDATTPDGGTAGSDPEMLIQQLIVEQKIDIGILTGTQYGWNVHPNPEYANAVVRAFNDWTIEQWLAALP